MKMAVDKDINNIKKNSNNTLNINVIFSVELIKIKQEIFLIFLQPATSKMNDDVDVNVVLIFQCVEIVCVCTDCECQHLSLPKQSDCLDDICITHTFVEE